MAPPSDRSWRPADTWLVVGLAALVFALKLPTLGTPGYGDEMGYLKQARWLADHQLHQVLPGTRPAAAFWGHPPGLHLSAAIPFKLFGVSRALAHLVIAGFAALGAVGTFLLARHWHDRRIGLLAALLLVLSPMYLAQAGLFLADLPVAALGVLSAYLVVTNRYVWYLLVASYMVVVKETAMAIVVALALYRVLSSQGSWRSRLIDGLRHAVPLVVIGAFVVTQKIVTGHAFFVFDFEFEPFAVTSVGQMVEQAGLITRWLFVEQFRWVFTLAILASLLIHPRAAFGRPTLRLFVLLVPMSGYAFILVYFVPRYLLPILPFFCIAAAAALFSLARTPMSRRGLAVAACTLMIWGLLREPPEGDGEANLNYRRGVRAHAAMARLIAEQHPNARLLTEWPSGNQLAEPVQGYVEKPLRVIWFRPGEPLPESDLAVVSSPSSDRMRALGDVAERSGWPILRRFTDGDFSITLYATKTP